MCCGGPSAVMARAAPTIKQALSFQFAMLPARDGEANDVRPAVGGCGVCLGGALEVLL